MKSFNDCFVKPSPVYRKLSSPLVKRVEEIAEIIDVIQEISEIYQASLKYKDGELNIILTIDGMDGWWTEPGLLDLIGLVDELKAYTNEKLGPDGILILELKVREKN